MRWHRNDPWRAFASVISLVASVGEEVWAAEKFLPIPQILLYDACTMAGWIQAPVSLLQSTAYSTGNQPLLGMRVLEILAGLLAAAAGVWIYRRMRMAKWPMTEGTIETVNVSAVRSLRKASVETTEYCTAEVSYSYSVAGQLYGGYWTQHFDDEQMAWDFVGPLKHRVVLVHYNPEHPEKSALTGFEV